MEINTVMRKLEHEINSLKSAQRNLQCEARSHFKTLTSLYDINVVYILQRIFCTKQRCNSIICIESKVCSSKWEICRK